MPAVSNRSDPPHVMKRTTSSLSAVLRRTLGRLAPTSAAADLGVVPDRVLAAPLAPVAAHADSEPWVALPDGFPSERLGDFVARDRDPLPAAEDREHYHGERHFDYWLSGLSDWWRLERAAERHAAPLKPGSTVLDLGCASGRVVRHFAAQRPDLDLYAVDINALHVDWVRRYLSSPRLRPFQNTVLPSLAIEDRAVDLLYAFSVFTHIDAFELAWLAELRRVLRPGGLAYVTIHSEHTWSSLRPEWGLWHGLVGRSRDREGRRVTPTRFASPMGADREVFRWKRTGNYLCNVFHHTDYVRRTWGRFLEVVEIVREGSDYQDVVILRRTPSSG